MFSWLLFSSIAMASDSVEYLEKLLDEKISSSEVLFAAIKNQALRPENISDSEVREIQKVVRDLYPEAIVQIGGVTAQCQCGEEPDCTNQVNIVSEQMEQGLVLSKVRGQWNVGEVQGWWLSYRAIRVPVENEELSLEIRNEIYEARLKSLLISIPTCNDI